LKYSPADCHPTKNDNYICQNDAQQCYIWQKDNLHLAE
jgi:hypothetical protein